MKRAFGTTTFGGWLRQQREVAGLTQAELARRVGLHKTAWSHWETGSNLPRWDVAEAVAATLGVDRAEMERRRVLAGGQPAPSKPDPETLIPWDRWCEAGSVLVLAGSWHDPEPGGETP